MDLQNKSKEELIQELKELQGKFNSLQISYQKNIDSHQKIENAFKNGEQKYFEIFNNINDAVYLMGITPEGTIANFIDVNDVACKMLGYSREEFMKMSPKDINVENTNNRMSEITRSLLTKQQMIIEVTHIAKDGRHIPVEINSSIVQIMGEQRILSIARDISGHKQVEKMLNKSQEIAHLGSWILEIPSNQLIWSEEVYRIFGLEPSEFGATYETFLDTIHPDDRTFVNNAYSDSLKEGKKAYEIEHRIVCKNSGEIRYVYEKCEHIKDCAGNIVRSIGLIQDITERKLSESKEIKLKRAVEHSPASIVITDVNGNIEYVNPKFTEVTGFTFEEALGKNPRVLKSGLMDPSVFKELWETLLDGKEWRGEMLNKKKNGELYWEFASISPIKADNENITHFVAVKEDITKQKKIQESLQKSEANLRQTNAEKDKFLSIMAHDLKNPFFALLGISELLLKNYESYSPEKIERFAKNIYESAKSTYNLLENLLEWSRSQQGKIVYKPVKLDLRNTLTNAVEQLRHTADTKNISINMELLKPICISADEYMLNTILRNLIGNAIKFSHRNGLIKVNAETLENTAKISISDNGVGIEKKDIQNLFRIDINTSQSGTDGETGTGLGLLLCKDFIEKSGGTISVESTVDIGTTFSFTIPLFSYSNETCKQKQKEQPDYSYTVLVAEDEMTNYMYLEEILLEMNIISIHAKNGKEAVEMIIQNPQINLILMDIKMPVLNGFDATIEIKKNNPDLPIIIQSAYALSTEKDKLIECGCDDYITKPINHKLLVDLINKHLHKWQ